MNDDFDFDAPQRKLKKATKPSMEKPVPLASEDDSLLDNAIDASLEPVEQKSKYDADELAAIFDELLFSGEYTEDVTIRGRLNITFRTRTAEEIKEITRIVDGATAVFNSTLDQARGLLQLQYALSFYQGKDLRSLKTEDKAKFIGKIPGPVVGKLLVELSKFDEKVTAACQEAEENF